MTNKKQFIELSRKLAQGLLREAIGYSVESEIPYFQGTVGYMVEAPLLWIRHSRFPILFVAYDQQRSDTLEIVATQLQIAKATEFFALLVVVPTIERTGHEADEVRRLVADSLYRYDFVVLDRQSLARIIAHSSSRQLVEIILVQSGDGDRNGLRVLGPLASGDDHGFKTGYSRRVAGGLLWRPCRFPALQGHLDLCHLTWRSGVPALAKPISSTPDGPIK